MRNKYGFTLVETLVALTILLIVMLGLVQAALLSSDSIVRSAFRDEAVRIGEGRLNGELRSAPPVAPYSSDDPDKSVPPPASRGINTVGGATDRGLKNFPFDTLTALAPPAPAVPAWTCTSDTGDRVWGNVRTVPKGYNVCWRIRNITGAEVVGLDVAVGWNHRLETPFAQRPTPTLREFQHSITSYVRRESP